MEFSSGTVSVLGEYISNFLDISSLNGDIERINRINATKALFRLVDFLDL